MVANIITSIRIFIIFIMSFFLLSGNTSNILESGCLEHIIFNFLFSVAAVTDFLDGYLARKYSKITFFGKVFDPISDKLLVIVAILFICKLSIYNSEFLSLILFVLLFIIMRDFLVTGLRILVIYKNEKNLVISPSYLGKMKTVITFSIIFVLLNFKIENLFIILLAFVTIVFLNFISAIDYLIKNFYILKNNF